MALRDRRDFANPVRDLIAPSLWAYTVFTLLVIVEKHCGLTIETAMLIRTRSQNRDTENYLGDLGGLGATGLVSFVGRYLTFLTEMSWAEHLNAERPKNQSRNGKRRTSISRRPALTFGVSSVEKTKAPRAQPSSNSRERLAL